MDLEKIGKFIAECRKKKNLTQSELAEKLFITDRAVSKWENGRALPDSSIMLNLCKILDITVNDLLSGEMISMENYNEEVEKKLLQAAKDKEDAHKKMLILERFIGSFGGGIFIILIFVASFIKMASWIRICLIILGLVIFIIAVAICLNIEQKAGYYECQKCGNRYVPKYSKVLFSLHTGTTRYMKCPKCHKHSW